MHDVAIIGAGPVGVFAAFQAGMLGLRACLIDAISAIGGQCISLYPEKPIYDIPAHPSILSAELIANLKAQADIFSTDYILNTKIESIEGVAGSFLLKSTGCSIQAKTIIIASGNGCIEPKRLPHENASTFEKNNSLHYMVTNKELFKDKAVAIAGGGDSAVDWAIILSTIAKKVYVIHRRDKFRASPHSVAQMHEIASKTNKIELLTHYQITSIIGEDGSLKAIDLEDMNSNSTKLINLDHLIAFYGLAAENNYMKNWGLTIEKGLIPVDPASMQTNLKGIFAIGDCVHYPGKLKLILTGFAEAACAMHNAYSIAHPDKALHFEHSTTKGLPNKPA